MTFRHFLKVKKTIEDETFHGSETNPLLFGIERAEFRKHQLERLIAAGQDVEKKIVQRQVASWKRQLPRLKASQRHFKEVRKKEGVF